ncbi:MAG: hypothetical protein ACE5OV_01135 [Candidatus Bathyarchaeia archaeon]
MALKTRVKSVYSKQRESSLKELPSCFGKWLSENSKKCEMCGFQLECYGKMRKEEKRKEKEEERKRIPWYKLTDLEEAFGVCETCG